MAFPWSFSKFLPCWFFVTQEWELLWKHSVFLCTELRKHVCCISNSQSICPLSRKHQLDLWLHILEQIRDFSGPLALWNCYPAQLQIYFSSFPVKSQSSERTSTKPQNWVCLDMQLGEASDQPLLSSKCFWSWFKKPFPSRNLTSACFKHIGKPWKSECFCSYAWVWCWIFSFAGEKDSLLLFSLLCIFLCSLTPSFVYQQPSKLKENCSLFNYCLEKTVSWSLYKWAGTRICFNSFQSLW